MNLFHESCKGEIFHASFFVFVHFIYLFYFFFSVLIVVWDTSYDTAVLPPTEMHLCHFQHGAVQDIPPHPPQPPNSIKKEPGMTMQKTPERASASSEILSFTFTYVYSYCLLAPLFSFSGICLCSLVGASFSIPSQTGVFFLREEKKKSYHLTNVDALV